MLLLVSTSDKIEVVTTTTANLDVHASFMDAPIPITSSSNTTPGNQNTTISTATTTEVVSEPSSSVVRNVRKLVVRNRHASASNDVTVRHVNASLTVEIIKVRLASGDQLIYEEGLGWIYSAAKLTTSTASELSVVRLASDLSNSTTTAAEVTGLQATLGAAGTYVYQYDIIYQAAVTTTGVKFSVNFTGTTTRHVNFQYWSDVSATASTAVPDQDNVGAAGHVMGTFASRGNSNAGRGVTLSVDTANADMYMCFQGILIAGGSGDLELWHGSEVAAQSTVMAGSSLRIWQTA